MEQELAFIWGSEQITEWFGYWPSFHDAEIHWIKLERPVPVHSEGASAEFLIHTWELADEKDRKGYLALHKYCLVHLRLEKCVEVQLEGFNCQNVLLRLGFEVEGSGLHKKLRVVLDASHGVCGSFLCDHVEVLGVTACDSEGVPIKA